MREGGAPPPHEGRSRTPPPREGRRSTPPPPMYDLYDKEEVLMYVVLKPEVVAAKTRPTEAQ